MPRRGRTFFYYGLFLLSLHSPVFGVDSWLVADKYVVKPGSQAWIAFITGDVFPIGDGIVDPTRVDGLIDLHDGRRIPIDGMQVEDDAVAIRRAFTRTGFHILGLSLKPRVIALDGDVFDEYLSVERAEDAMARRQSQGADKSTVRERYTKYAKTILEVGAAQKNDMQFQMPIGHRLEFIPMSNPVRWQAGDEVSVKLLLDGHPWPAIPVSATHEGMTDGTVAIRTQTDEQGIARWRLTQSGQWCARAHFIRPVNGLVNYDWESFWATYSFGVRGKGNVSGSMQLLRAIHGDINPWAVAGFLIGERALTDLDLGFGSERLLALYHCPQRLPYTAVLDGIQAATGATVGKLNLRLIPSDESSLRCEFIDMETSRKLVYQLTPAMQEQMLATPSADARALALQMMTLHDAEIFFEMNEKQNGSIDESKKRKDPPPLAAPNKKNDSAIKAVKIQARAESDTKPLSHAEPLRLNLPTLATQASSNPFQTLYDESDQLTPLNKSHSLPSGPGETFWKLTHQQDEGAKLRSLPSRDWLMPGALATGR